MKQGLRKFNRQHASRLESIDEDFHREQHYALVQCGSHLSERDST